MYLGGGRVLFLLVEVGIPTGGLDALDLSVGQGFYMAVHGVLWRERE